MLPGLTEDPLQDIAARDGVLFGQRVEQVQGVVVMEGARPPRSHPGTVPVASHDVRRLPPGDPDSTGQKQPSRPASLAVLHQRHPAVRTVHLLPWYHAVATIRAAVIVAIKDTLARGATRTARRCTQLEDHLHRTFPELRGVLIP